MQKIRNLWFADWSTERGKRFRLGFKTKKKAERYQAKMRAEVALGKKTQASRESRRSPRRGQKRKAHATTRSSQRSRTRGKRVHAAASKTSARTSATSS
jgi:hypothetical protein